MTGERGSSAESESRNGDHLDELPDGSGCTEIWEHLSERRAAEGDD